MSDFIAVRGGQPEGSEDTRGLFLKEFAGEVLTAFAGNNIMTGRHRVRNIAHGKSAQFPVTGKVGAQYHTPGTELKGQGGKHSERIITIDDVLLSDVFIPDIDQAMSHYDYRSPLSTEMGRKLAKEYDMAVFKEVIRASRSGASVSDGFGGSQISNDKFKLGAGGATNIEELAREIAGAIFAGAQIFDEKDIPETDRFCAVTPQIYNALVQNKEAINKDWGGEGAYSDGKLYKIAGVTILKSNNIPHSDTTETDAFHGIDASKTCAVMWTPDAIGTVKLMDLSLQSEDSVRHQGTLMVARYAVGHGVLRPDCAIEFKLDTLTY